MAARCAAAADANTSVGGPTPSGGACRDEAIGAAAEALVTVEAFEAAENVLRAEASAERDDANADADADTGALAVEVKGRAALTVACGVAAGVWIKRRSGGGGADVSFESAANAGDCSCGGAACFNGDLPPPSLWLPL